MTTETTTLATILAALDDLWHLRDLLGSAHNSVQAALAKMDKSDWDYNQIEAEAKVLKSAYSSVDELVVYLS